MKEIILPVSFTDWLSLAKARFLLQLMSGRTTVFWVVLFVTIDVAVTLVLLVSVLILSDWLRTGRLSDSTAETLDLLLLYYTDTDIISLGPVAFASTMMTSAWVLLFALSVVLLKLLGSLEYIRRFTLWWFKDIDAHPLSAIAKVAATLIVIGAFALKAVRWGWLIV